ncbi:MAG: hypothetical protein MN733_05710 [Nitrososphaera sp.]|nr:hypothetical protein [Nitrososphaera sp.]
MTRIQAVSLFLAAVLILVISVTALVVAGSQSGLTITMTQESYITLTFRVAAPAESGVILFSNCNGCSGGGSGGG